MKNGQVWYDPNACRHYIIQWLDLDKFALLCAPTKAAHGGRCMMFQTDKNARWMYTEAEMAALLADRKMVLTEKIPAVIDVDADGYADRCSYLMVA